MATATCCESREPGEVGGASRRRLSDLETNLVMQGWNVWTCAEVGKWIYWTKDVKHGAARKEEVLRKDSVSEGGVQRVGVTDRTPSTVAINVMHLG